MSKKDKVIGINTEINDYSDYEDDNNNNNTDNNDMYKTFNEEQSLKDEITKLKEENKKLEEEALNSHNGINKLNNPDVKKSSDYIDSDHVYKLYEDKTTNEKIKKIKEIKEESKVINVEKKLLYIFTLIAVVIIGYNIYTTYMEEHTLDISLSTISLVKTRSSFGTYDINYLITPSDISKIPRLESNNDNVIINSTSGTIKANNVGESEIKVYDIDKNKKVVSTIKVFVVDSEIHLTDFYTENEEYNLKVGEKQIIKITAEPENTTDLTYIFSSNKPNVASVVNSVIEAKSEGSTIIKITNNKIVKTITVNVSK